MVKLIAVGLLGGFLALSQSAFGQAQGPPSSHLGDTNPRWAPAGQLIAFVSTRELKSEVYVMNADGSAPRRLTTSPSGMSSSAPV